MRLPDFLADMMRPAITPRAVRSEIYFLGSRHHGEALEGAMAELKACRFDADRSRLLRAVVVQLKRDERTGGLSAATD
jgi:hypothetical protein